MRRSIARVVKVVREGRLKGNGSGVEEGATALSAEWMRCRTLSVQLRGRAIRTAMAGERARLERLMRTHRELHAALQGEMREFLRVREAIEDARAQRVARKNGHGAAACLGVEEGSSKFES